MNNKQKNLQIKTMKATAHTIGLDLVEVKPYKRPFISFDILRKIKKSVLFTKKMEVGKHTIGLDLVEVKPSLNRIIEYREKYEIIYEKESFKEFIQRIYTNIIK